MMIEHDCVCGGDREHQNVDCERCMMIAEIDRLKNRCGSLARQVELYEAGGTRRGNSKGSTVRVMDTRLAFKPCTGHFGDMVSPAALVITTKPGETIDMETTVTKKTNRPVVITTQYRGVFFGYAEDTSGDCVTLTRARMCVYWASSLHGVLGLASNGPSPQCRIGDPVESIELRGVTAVIEVSNDAVDKWEDAPWK